MPVFQPTIPFLPLHVQVPKQALRRPRHLGKAPSKGLWLLGESGDHHFASKLLSSCCFCVQVGRPEGQSGFLLWEGHSECWLALQERGLLEDPSPSKLRPRGERQGEKAQGRGPDLGVFSVKAPQFSVLMEGTKHQDSF